MFASTASTLYRKSGHAAYIAVSPEEREALITQHLPKVKYIADRMAAKLPPSVERDDLYGAGVVGLIDAVERFDASRGVAFTTFAEMRVRGAILDNLRSLDWASRNSRRRAREIQEAFAAVEKEKGGCATEEEVAAQMQIPLAELRDSMREMRDLTVMNLDEPETSTGLSFSELLSDHTDSPLEDLEKAEHRRMLAQAIDRLPEKEHQVIALYYLEELNMKETGEVLGVSESCVSQLRTQAIIRLRAKLSK
jgi:RNA polymerase sigma factor for flagellar operon FliA